MVGIIQQKMPKDPNLVAGYEAEKIELDQGDTVEGRIGGIINKESPLMKRAATQGLQQANRRGLLNSSIAIGEAENAVYGAALPIASQDASTSFQSKALNQNASNTALQFNAGNVASRQYQAAGIEGESRLLQERGDIEKALQKAEGETRMRLLNRQGQIDNQLQQLRGQQEMALVRERGNIEKALQRAEGATRMALLNRQGQIDTQLQNIRGSQAQSLQQLQGQQNLNLQRLQGTQAMQQIGAQGAVSTRLAALDASTQRALQTMRGDQATQLAQIENRNRSEIQASQSASLFYSQTADRMADVLNNPEIPAAQKQSLINRQLELLENGLSLIGGISGLDLSTNSNLRFGH